MYNILIYYLFYIKLILSMKMKMMQFFIMAMKQIFYYHMYILNNLIYKINI